MSGPGNDSGGRRTPWRVRFAGQTYRVKDREALERLIELGRVPDDAAVQPPGEDGWLTLSEALSEDASPAVRPAAPVAAPPAKASPPPAAPGARGAKDPWSVWEDMDDDGLDDPAAAASAEPAPPRAPQPVDDAADDATDAHDVVAADAADAADVAADAADDAASDELASDDASADDPSEPTGRKPWRPQRSRIGAEPAPPRHEPPSAPTTREPKSRGTRPAGAASSTPPAPGKARPRAESPAPPPEAPVRPTAPSTGKVIQFPGPRAERREIEGVHALQPETVPFPDRAPVARGHRTQAPTPLDFGDFPAARPRRARPDEKKGTNWWRVAAIGLVGLVGVGMAHWYIQMNSTAEFKGPRVVAAPPGAEAIAERLGAGEADVVPDEPTAPVTTNSGDDPYEYWRPKEEELRARMIPESQQGALEDVLYVEFNRMRLDVVRTDIDVLAWTGPEGDQVDSARIRVLLRSDGGDLGREIGAVALVIGKYAQDRGFSVPEFVIAFEGIEDDIVERPLDIDLAKKFYLGKLKLGEFLEEVAQR